MIVYLIQIYLSLNLPLQHFFELVEMLRRVGTVLELKVHKLMKASRRAIT